MHYSPRARDESDREFVVRAAVKAAAGLVLTSATPLLEEEEGYPLDAALTTNVDHPRSKHRPGVWATLAADDDPIDATKIDLTKIG
jgi:hypothetical protein